MADDALVELWEQGRRIDIPRGSTVFHQGASGTTCLIILEGHLKAWALQGDREQPISDVRPGELVGEAALFARTATRTASLRAVTDSVALELTADDLLALSGSTALAALQRHMVTTAARRLRTTHLAARKLWLQTLPPPDDSPAPPSSVWARLSRFLGGTA